MTHDSDFTPEKRRSAWWSGDSRRAVTGHLIDVILEKRGEKEIADLSEVEVVQMGHVMQPYIGKIFEDTTGIGVRDFDLPGIHPSEQWLRAHTDFVTADGGLLEVKNYNASTINKYSEPDTELRLPPADFIQCVHEATVFGVPHVHFAVLFGGQRFRHWRVDVNDAMKADFVQQAAKWWALCQVGDLPTPETVEQAKLVYSRSTDEQIIANAAVEQVVQQLKAIKDNIKTLEDQEERAQLMLQNYMQQKGEIIAPSGEVLVSWKQSKSTKSFDSKAFQFENPALYEQYKIEKPGSRRFLVK